MIICRLHYGFFVYAYAANVCRRRCRRRLFYAIEAQARCYSGVYVVTRKKMIPHYRCYVGE